MPPGGMQGPGPRAGPPGKVENDRWGKRSLPPPPPGMGGAAAGNLPALHQAEKKFKVCQEHGVMQVVCNNCLHKLST